MRGWNERGRISLKGPVSVPASALRLAILYALTGFPRLLLLAYLPLAAIQYLQDARAVSIAFFSASFGAVAASAAVPSLVHRLSRKWAYIAVNTISVVSFAALSTGWVPLFFFGLFLFVTSAAANEILLNVYALENLERFDQKRYEPLRVTFSLAGFIFAPAIGVAAGTLGSPRLPFALAAICAWAGLAFFLRTALKQDISSSRLMPSPSQYLRRFFGQPRLRLAYVLSFGRAAWWQMLFVYCPILMLHIGFSTRFAGFISAIALGMTVSVPIWALAVKVLGVRYVEALGFAVAGVLMLAVCPSGYHPNVVVALIVCSALFMASLDSVGNVFFLRAVRSYERVEMASVFSTYRDASQIVAPMIVGPLLGFFDIIVVFGIWGGLLLALAGLSLYLPRSM